MTRGPRFTGRAVLVTGGAGGMGTVIVETLLAHDARVGMLDVDQERLNSAVAELGDSDSLLALRADTSDREQVRDAVRDCLAHFGRLDGLVAQAGIAELRPFIEIDDAGWDRTLAVNLTGVFYAVQESARAMIANGRGGAVVVTSSTNAFFPEDNTVAYSASKGGLVAFVKAAALDLSRYGIRINAISPGIIRTRLAEAVFEDPAVSGPYLSRVPMGRFGEPSEVATVVAFLLSDEASYMTGENVVVDGGTTLGVSLGIQRALPGFE
jgi:NAD(P)-dependent dehydrogenase (short-subunit alcohol dehydrogenase family)